MDTPWSKQGLGSRWQLQSTQCGRDQSAWAGLLTGGERGPAGDEGGPAKGGQEEEPRGGLPDLQSSPAFQPNMFLQNALSYLNSPANLRRSWSLPLPKSKHLRRLLLSAALLMLLPCLELTNAAHQPPAKPYSTVATVAVCLHEAREPSSTTAITAWQRSLIV